MDEAAPDLARRVRDGSIEAPLRGSVGLPNHVRRAAGPGWALVGDAGYQLERDAAIEDTFRLTRALGGFPSPEEFLDLLRRYDKALDAEAQALAARPARAGGDVRSRFTSTA